MDSNSEKSAPGAAKAGRTRTLIALLTLALICALAVAGLLGWQLWRATLTEVALRLDPLELNFYAGWPQLATAKPGVPRVVFYGDSRARSWPLFEERVEFEYVNRGIGYQTSEQVLGRTERDLAPLDPDVVVLQAGINDLKAIELWPNRRDAIVARCERNLRALVDRSLALGAQVILMTIFSTAPPSWLRGLLLPGGLEQGISLVNASLRTLASERVSIFESSAVLDDATGHIRADFQLDFLHVNEVGYRALDRAMRRRLASIRARAR